jgi:siderophore synthetase component
MKNKTIRFAVIGIVLTTLVASLTKCTGVEEKYFYDLLDEIQRKYFPQTELNEYIIKDEKLLKRRIERDVDRAIEKVEPEYDRIIKEADKIYQPKLIEKPVNTSDCYSDECKALGGEMRICAPWVSDCK